MATLTKHAQGTFCWPEAYTTDQAAAKRFYTSLFGWTTNDIPMPPEAGGGHYTIFQLDGKDVGAMCTLQPDMLKQGVPPYWGAYIAVDNADAVVSKAKQLGGTVMMEPMDVMGGIGRTAILQDPTGAMFSVWQGGSHIGAGVLDQPGALGWTELMTGDTAKAKAFYTALIGWSAADMPMGDMTYTLFQRAGGVNAAGMMALTAEMKGVPPNWGSYFQVADIRKTVERATALGAKVHVPVTPIPNVGEFAVLGDPQGAVFNLLQMAK